MNPHIETPHGRTVNVLVRGREYLYTYRVKFSTPAFKVRFGMLIKTVSGSEISGAVTHTASEGIEYVEAGQVAHVTFRFGCLLNPAVYFLNAGVLGMVESGETFLDRHIDVAMFRVQAEPNLKSTAIADLCVGSDVSLLASAAASIQTAG